MGTTTYLVAAGLLGLTLIAIRIWQTGVEYGRRDQQQRYRAAAMVADELHKARARRKAGAA